MNYSEFITKERFELDELIACAYGRLVDDPPVDFDFFETNRSTNISWKMSDEL